VRLALPIDPMLAAEMIYRALPAVWEIVKADIIAFVDRWHRPGTVDRAVRFMIMTGRPEFESRVWPLASSANSQVQLPTLRTAPRFRPSVLGPDFRSKVAALPDVDYALARCLVFNLAFRRFERTLVVNFAARFICASFPIC
jgi:hypothetical protein